MRFLLSADLHLDSPLRAQALRNPELARELRLTSRHVLDRIIEIAIEAEVDALLLAGDIFDNSVADVTGRAALAAALARLGHADVPAVLIRGNHDALLDLERYGPLGDAAILLGAHRPSVQIGQATVHGLGFTGRHAGQSLLPHYPPPEPGRLNVGLMHTSLGGTTGHDPYAPCAEADLLAHGYDLWALGHIHQRFERRSARALAVMPGIPQGRSIRETGGGSVTLVTLDGAGARSEEIPVATVRFLRDEVDLSKAASQADRIDAMAARMRACSGTAPMTALRLVLRGAGPLRGDPALARALATEAADTVPGLFLEALRFAPDAPSLAAGTLAEVATLMAEDATAPGLRDAADALLDDWRQALPREIADVLDPAKSDALIAEGIALVLARLDVRSGQE